MRKCVLPLLVALLAVGLTCCAIGGPDDETSAAPAGSEATPPGLGQGLPPGPEGVRPEDATFDPASFTEQVRAKLGEEGRHGDERSQWVVSTRTDEQEIRIRTTLVPGREDVVSATFVCLLALEVAIPAQRPQMRVEARDGSALAWSHWEDRDGWTCGAGMT